MSIKISVTLERQESFHNSTGQCSNNSVKHLRMLMKYQAAIIKYIVLCSYAYQREREVTGIRHGKVTDSKNGGLSSGWGQGR